MDRLAPQRAVLGRVRACQILPGGSRLWTPWRSNLVMYDWAAIVAQLLSTGAAAYRISGMFLEFQNVADPDDDVTPPDFGREDGIAYYNGLSGSPDIDYLRLPLVAAAVDSTDAVLFPTGNRITFFAQSQASVGAGVHGKNFTDIAISKVFGGALVAIPDLADRTRDLVFSRFYFDAELQQVKLASAQLGLEWSIELQ